MSVSQAAVEDPDNTKLPGTVFTPRQVRMLKAVVIGLGVVLVVGLLLVIVGMAMTAMHMGEGRKPAAAVAPAVAVKTAGGKASAAPVYDLRVPAGATALATALDGDRLALTLKTQTGTEIVVLDLKTGARTATVKLTPGKSDRPSEH